jgi:hypothetical protein
MNRSIELLLDECTDFISFSLDNFFSMNRSMELLLDERTDFISFSNHCCILPLYSWNSHQAIRGGEAELWLQIFTDALLAKMSTPLFRRRSTTFMFPFCAASIRGVSPYSRRAGEQHIYCWPKPRPGTRTFSFLAEVSAPAPTSASTHLRSPMRAAKLRAESPY